MLFKIGLGSRVKDSVTGFTGIVTSRTEWMSGCIRYGVQAEKVGKDGAVPEAIHFDEMQLVVLKPKDVTAAMAGRSGGPKPAPRRSADPRR